jgi:hypothetical protein
MQAPFQTTSCDGFLTAGEPRMNGLVTDGGAEVRRGDVRLDLGASVAGASAALCFRPERAQDLCMG